MEKKHYNHQERRNLEKQFGLKKPTNKKDLEDYYARKREAGKQLHEQFTENVINAQDKDAAEREKKQIENFMADGLTFVEAKEKVLKNYEIQRKRREKLENRAQRQKERQNK